MDSISTGLVGLAAAAATTLALTATPAAPPAAIAVAKRGPAATAGSASLCAAGETPIFSCPLGAKTASVCGSDRQAVYRYGAPAKVEMTSRHLALAKQGFSGGGETQIQVTNGNYVYVLFDKTVRTGFGGGQNDPESRSGLIVRRAGKTLSSRYCANDAPIPARASNFMPAGGAIVAH